MNRSITGYHLDDDGDWVAELDCLHNQHVRHNPPFQLREWTQTPEGRAAHVGDQLDCPWCDLAELPEGLRLARTAGPWNESTVPGALRRAHLVAQSTWGNLTVIAGEVRITLETAPPIDVTVAAGQAQPIPPGVPHHLTIVDPVTLAVEFYVKA
ncbi:MAG: DUF3565 domain-containing protein [Ilumatobacteraceae bacterium]